MTTDINELVKRLRDGWSGSLRHAAADALEAMAGERDRTRDDYEAMKAHNKELFGKLSAAELERDRLAGEVERLKAEIDNIKQVEFPKRAEAITKPLLVERDRLKAALEPFAKLSTDRERQDPPEGTMRVRVVTAPEIEAARKALGGDAS